MGGLGEGRLKKREALLCLLFFVLWTLPGPLIDNPSIKVLGMPLLWLYYMALSVSTALAITLVYLLEERGGRC